jgi:hypothetical protein
MLVNVRTCLVRQSLYLHIVHCAGPVLGVGGLGAAGVGAMQLMQARACPQGQCRVRFSGILQAPGKLFRHTGTVLPMQGKLFRHNTSAG